MDRSLELDYVRIVPEPDTLHRKLNANDTFPPYILRTGPALHRFSHFPADTHTHTQMCIKCKLVETISSRQTHLTPGYILCSVSLLFLILSLCIALVCCLFFRCLSDPPTHRHSMGVHTRISISLLLSSALFLFRNFAHNFLSVTSTTQ